MSEPRFARDLRPGDRIVVDREPFLRNIVRTVADVTDTGMVNHHNVPILCVHYAEGHADGWSAGNTWSATSLVGIA